MTRSHRLNNTANLVSLTTRVFRGEHYELVRSAAARAGFSVSEYLRHLILNGVAADLGIEPLDLSEYSGRDVIAEAAAADGMDREAWSARAVRDAALARIRADAEIAIANSREVVAAARATRDTLRAAGNGTAPGSGTYSLVADTATPRRRNGSR